MNTALIIISTILCVVFISLSNVVRSERCRSKNYQSDSEGWLHERKTADMKYQDCMDIFGYVILFPTIMACFTDKHGHMSTPWFWTRIGVFVVGIIYNVIFLLSPAPDM